MTTEEVPVLEHKGRRLSQSGVIPDYLAIVRWLGNIKKLDRWMHPYELMPGHLLQ